MAGSGIARAIISLAALIQRRPVLIAGSAEQRRQILQLLGHHMDDLTFPLNVPSALQHGCLEHDMALPLEQIRPDDHICNTGFIFNGDENYAGCRHRTLTQERPGGDRGTPAARHH
jgi:hypothetical protein